MNNAVKEHIGWYLTHLIDHNYAELSAALVEYGFYNVQEMAVKGPSSSERDSAAIICDCLGLDR